MANNYYMFDSMMYNSTVQVELMLYHYLFHMGILGKDAPDLWDYDIRLTFEDNGPIEDGPVVFLKTSDSGRVFRDIIDAGTICFFLISKKLKQLLEDNNITGWTTYDVIILDCKQECYIQGYYGFRVTGKMDDIHKEGDIVVSPDFFNCRKQITCSQKVKDLFKQEKITCAKFIPLDESLKRLGWEDTQIPFYEGNKKE